MEQIKTLTVTITETEEKEETRFKTEGLTEFEIVGILSYYLDIYKVKMMRGQQRNSTEETEKE
jgi:hypothetical protein